MGAPILSEEEKTKRLLARKNNPEYNEKRRAYFKRQNEKRKKNDVFLIPEPILSKDSTSSEWLNIQFPEGVQRKGPGLHKDDTNYAADLDEKEGVVYDFQCPKGRYILKKYQSSNAKCR